MRRGNLNARRPYNPPMKFLWPAPALLLALLALPASAEVYRCEHAGKITYTDQPCAANAAPAELPRLNEIPAERGAVDLARQYDRDAAAQAKTQAGADVEWLKRHRDEAARDAAARKAVAENRVIKGMTPAEVERVLSRPDRIENQGQPNERWLYDNGRAHRSITFGNGVVSADRTRTTRR